ncbi:silicon efflux transporter LSI2-like [Populus nigra]|uniref:silicon efflux transporter LSI2-like n=1 Tax=Populus nigra TaxID=3691 RepID=UPI002B2701BB|nr:silicon efflux transporter LSI2-like [Populus nigra]
MDLCPFKKVVLGSVAFAIFRILAVSPAVPFLPIGRTAGSILGATLMVIFKAITPKQAYDAIDLPVLGLLFGTMVVSIYLERADMFKHLGVLLSWKSRGAKDMLCRICIVSAISSALFTNDTACFFLTEFILKIARQNNIRPEPFLFGLASSSNIGSSATPIGNPQNLIIAIQSGISFGEFVLGLLPAVLVGVFVNALILICMFRRLLSDVKEEEDALYEMIVLEDSAVHQISLATMSSPNSLESHEYDPIAEHVNAQRLCELDMCSDSCGEIELMKAVLSKEATDNMFSEIGEPMEERFARGGVQGTMEKMTDLESGPQQSAEESKGLLNRWKRLSWKLCIYLGTVGMLVAFLMGSDMSWTALTAALIFVILDFKDAGPCLEKVSYSLLVFFCGMFITVDGFNRTGIPSSFWNLMEPHALIDHASGIAVLAIAILVLSNVASNVPTVLLLGAKVAASAIAISSSKEKKAWLILAWVSTVAGNLSLLGSAANIIVCELALRAQPSYNITFWSHLKFGVPSTLIVTTISLAVVYCYDD